MGNSTAKDTQNLESSNAKAFKKHSGDKKSSIEYFNGEDLEKDLFLLEKVKNFRETLKKYNIESALSEDCESGFYKDEVESSNFVASSNIGTTPMLVKVSRAISANGPDKGPVAPAVAEESIRMANDIKTAHSKVKKSLNDSFSDPVFSVTTPGYNAGFLAFRAASSMSALLKRVTCNKSLNEKDFESLEQICNFLTPARIRQLNNNSFATIDSIPEYMAGKSQFNPKLEKFQLKEFASFFTLNTTIKEFFAVLCEEIELVNRITGGPDALPGYIGDIDIDIPGWSMNDQLSLFLFRALVRYFRYYGLDPIIRGVRILSELTMNIIRGLMEVLLYIVDYALYVIRAIANMVVSTFACCIVLTSTMATMLRIAVTSDRSRAALDQVELNRHIETILQNCRDGIASLRRENAYL